MNRVENVGVTVYPVSQIEGFWRIARVVRIGEMGRHNDSLEVPAKSLAEV